MPSKSNPRISEAGAPDISDWGPACQAVLTNEFLAEMCQLVMTTCIRGKRASSLRFGASVPVRLDLGQACQLVKIKCIRGKRANKFR